MSAAVEAEATSENKTAGCGGMSPEQMEAWAKLASAGPAHQVFKPMVGDFRAEVTFVMGGEQKSTGIMRNRLVLGGRFLENRYEGDGGQMSGIGFVGYDNGKRAYTGLWMDTMSTKIMVSHGSIDASGKVITATAEMDNPMQGGKLLSRNVTTIIDNDRHTYEMFMPGPDGREFRCLNIVYTRVK